MEDQFYVVAAILGVATLVGFVATRLRQPLIVAFIGVGILVGPAALGWVERAEPVELLAEIGIAVLLFLVGLKLDLNLVRTTGPVALVTGLGQVAFTSGVGFVLALLLGMDATTALYVAVALTFSSTIIIVKLLSDKRELEDLHGRIAIGFLIVQDIVVVLVMIALTAFGGQREGALTAEVLEVLAKGFGFLAAVAVAMRWVLPRLLHLAARSPELLVVFAVTWAVALAAVSEWLGFSTEVGAFLAGFSIASTPYRESVASRLAPLRDFLLLFFFIELGAKLELADAGAQVVAAVVLSLFVLVGNPLIVLVIMGAMGYRKRVGFLAGLTVAQISEFSLILASLGLALGHIGSDTVGLITLVGLITIGLSTYLILYSHPLYDRLSPLLSVFERAAPTRGDEPHVAEEADVILYGLGRFGSNLADRLTEAGMSVIAVEQDPQARTLQREQLTVWFGDAEDAEFPGSLPLARVRWVVSTIPRVEITRVLVGSLRHWGYQGRIAVTAHSGVDASRLAACGADLVLEPFVAASDEAIGRLLSDIGATADREASP